jgi:hypothetical protein
MEDKRVDHWLQQHLNWVDYSQEACQSCGKQAEQSIQGQKNRHIFQIQNKGEARLDRRWYQQVLHLYLQGYLAMHLLHPQDLLHPRQLSHQYLNYETLYGHHH